MRRSPRRRGRTAVDSQPLRLSFDVFDLDEANARLSRDGRPVSLPPKALAVLCTLARQRGQLVTRNALLDAVWGHRHLSDSVLKTAIGEVRAALADDPREPRYIETVARFGYRFVAGPAVETAPAHFAPTSVTPRARPASMVGRAAALAALREAWKRTGSAQQLVWIVGEAGVGKTTLIEHFTGELPAAQVVHGQCVEHLGSGEPYLPLLEALRELCRRDPELPATLRAVAPTWIVQMPWLLSEAHRAALQRELVGAHQARMLRELRELLERLTAQAPLVVVLEDLHWSDLETLRMMEYFARSARTLRVLWIASFRLTQVIAEDHPLRGLRQELRMHHLCTELLLDSFSEAEVSAYLERRFPGARIAEQFVKRLHAHTDGLPLFVSNVVDTLCAQGGSPDWLAASGSELPVPESLAGVIERQIRRLPEEAQTLLDAASVCGMEFRAALVAELLDREASWVARQCDELARRGLWLAPVGIVELPDGSFDSRFAFLHALYQHVCYQRLAASQRVQHHRRVARAMERDHALVEHPAAELALHYERGHETLAALRAYGEAAKSALARFAPREAEYLSAHGLSLLERASESLERMGLEFELLRPGGVAASLIHGVAAPQARDIIERVRALYERLPQTPQRAVALDGMGWVYYVRAEFNESLNLARRLEEVATRHGEEQLLVFACNLMGVSLAGLGQLAESWRYLERGIAICAGIEGERPKAAFVIDPEASMRLNAAPVLANLGRIDQARAQLAAGIARAELIRQPIALMLAHWAGGMLHVRLDDSEGVARHAAVLATIVETTMLTHGEGPALWLRGFAEAHAGELRLGYEHIRQGYERHARFGMYAGCPEVLGYAAEALTLAHDWLAAQQQLDEAQSLALRIGERFAIPTLHLLQARIALGRGDAEAAQGAIQASLEGARAQGAAGLELKALLARAQLPQRTREHLAELETACHALTEGHDIPTYRGARKLLAAA